MAAKTPKDNSERNEEEYAALLAIFKRFIEANGDEDSQLAILEELIALRAEQAIQYACDGFGMTREEAIALLTSTEIQSELNQAKQRILAAAFENLVDFAVAEEYQMVSDLPESEDDEDEEELNEGEMEEYLSIFRTYNHRYAKTENSDVEYAMMVAAGLVAVKGTTILTYMTQGDERVRPWHRTYEGYSAPKSSFPQWLVPPIEHMCRCFLIEDYVMEADGVMAYKKPNEPEMPDWFNRTFKESVAFGGRIFSDEHPYFQIAPEHNVQLQLIAKRIKDIYFNG